MVHIGHLTSNESARKSWSKSSTLIGSSDLGTGVNEFAYKKEIKMTSAYFEDISSEILIVLIL